MRTLRPDGANRYHLVAENAESRGSIMTVNSAGKVTLLLTVGELRAVIGLTTSRTISRIIATKVRMASDHGTHYRS